MALETTATFIGHNECFGLSAEKLKNAIRELIEKGVTDFLSGGQGGFDRLCGRCVYELKKEFPHINNYLVMFYVDGLNHSIAKLISISCYQAFADFFQLGS